ncbi:MAG: hypothetical protein ABH852_00885 [Methanobacteriota archaeon]
MRRFQFIIGILAFAFLIDCLLYLFQPLGENFYIIGDSAAVLFSFSAVVFGISAFKSHQFSDLQGKALFFLTFGIFFWFLGETTWAIYEVILGLEVPVASVADVFWIVGYPVVLISLYYIWKLVLWPTGKKNIILLAIFLLVVSFILWYLSIPALTDVGLSAAEKVSTAGYVIGDMLVVDALIVVVVYLFRSKFLKTWGLILIAMIMTTIADVYYLHFLDIYQVGNLIDLFWDLSYITLALAFIYHKEKWNAILSAT